MSIFCTIINDLPLKIMEIILCNISNLLNNNQYVLQLMLFLFFHYNFDK